MSNLNITLGCDPEMFLIDIEGSLRSSIGKIGGSKRHPLPLPIGEGFAVQEDNVAIEFNIPAAGSRMDFVASITRAVEHLTQHVGEQYGYGISKLSAASFPEAELSDPAAKEFGCDPDFNAHTGRRNPRPKAADANLRSCGGHIHIGYDRKLADPRSIIRFMDLHAGVPSVLMDNGELRKQLYGKAGAFRPKPYGCEYRSLSNFWIFDEATISWAWEATNRAVEQAMSGVALSDSKWEQVVNSINSNDKAMAQQLCQEFNLQVV